MKTFKKFIEDTTPHKKYIAVQYDPNTQDRLREWCNDNGFDLAVGYGGEPQDPKQFDFHTTIFYTSNEIDYLGEEPGYELPEVYKATPIKIEMLGEDKNIPVLLIKYDSMIKELREKYEDLGLEDKWPDYKPHISLSYAKTDIDTSNMKLPTFDLNYDYVKVENTK